MENIIKNNRDRSGSVYHSRIWIVAKNQILVVYRVQRGKL